MYGVFFLQIKTDDNKRFERKFGIKLFQVFAKIVVSRKNVFKETICISKSVWKSHVAGFEYELRITFIGCTIFSSYSPRHLSWKSWSSYSRLRQGGLGEKLSHEKWKCCDPIIKALPNCMKTRHLTYGSPKLAEPFSRGAIPINKLASEELYPVKRTVTWT
jgi:hypothetical protein